MKIPIFNIIYRSGSILVNRKDPNSKVKSMHAMIDTLNQGLHLVLYPEGTRNKTDQPLQPFFDGAFNVAISAQKDIIPAILFNTKKILPNKPAFWAWPHTIYFNFLPPVSTKGLEKNNVKEVKENVYNIMEQYIIENR